MIGSFVKWLAVFIVFAGILGPLVTDIMLILSQPSIDNLKKLGYDIAKTIVSSQSVIKESVDEMKETEDYTYKWYLFYRIVSASLITFLIIYVFYKIINSVLIEPASALILALAITGIIVWAFSGVLGEAHPMPFYGWFYLAQNYEVIVEFLSTTYSITPKWNTSPV